MSSLTRASVGREPVTAEDCGSDCGAASRAGREHLQGSSPPDSTLSRIQGDLVRVPRRSARARASVRDASDPYAGAHGRLVSLGWASCHEHDGCPTTIVETNHSFEDSRAVGQGMEVRAELDSAVVTRLPGLAGPEL